MVKSVLVGIMFASLFAVGLVTSASADDGPDRMTNRAACKRWTEGDAQEACIACVSEGGDYFRSSGECQN
jgi:hypothetical protein